MDAFAEHEGLLITYIDHYNNWKEKQKIYNKLLSQASTKQLDIDYKQFLLTELEQLKLNDGNELSNLEEELKLFRKCRRNTAKVAKYYSYNRSF